MERFAAIALLLSLAGTRAADPRGVEFFETKVRPVLVEHCYSCHSAKEKKSRGGLTLDSRAAVLKGGDSGPALVPGKPDQSLLIKAIRHAGDLKMPQKNKLPDRLIADLAEWVRLGAPAPEDAAVAAGIDWTKAREFWAFRPVRRPALPPVRNAGWAASPIDRFVLARLEAENLTPVAPADRRALLRRVTFDLTGIPPTPTEVAAFVADERPGAYQRVVDGLLASPAFGERWGRHWLDVARYAEDQAHTFAVKPYTNAWRYRDWVLTALDADLPYDRFVRLQIAADLLGDAQPEDRAALGFFGLGAQYYNNSNPRAAADELDDRVDTLARGFLGLTVSCARCHDHKYDPVPTRDYYSLAGVFRSSKMAEVFLAPADQVAHFQAARNRLQDADRAMKDFLRAEKARLAAEKADKLADYLVAVSSVQASGAVANVARRQQLDRTTLDRMTKLVTTTRQPRLTAALEPFAKKSPPADVEAAARKMQERLLSLVKRDDKALKGEDKALVDAFFGDKGVFALPDDRVAAAMTGEKKEKLDGLRAAVQQVQREQPAAPPAAHGLTDAAPADMKVFVRGNPARQGELAPRRFLKVLSAGEPARFTRGSGRLDLADAIAAGENPLTARVIVNRLWAHHFGRGIVGTPSNFGALGERPTHPELLDWLAAELVESGWSLKHVHRLIVTSATYRLGGERHEGNLSKDPDNRLLWRANRRRLDVEAWRDALLAASGELDRTRGGPTLDLGANSNRRRTVYAKVSRHELNGLLRLFDFPDANITSEKRTETTVPQQQLFVLNSPFMLARAKGLAERVQREASDDEGRVRRAHELAFGRAALDEEVRVALAFLAASDEPGEKAANQLSRWQRYAHVLLASNEFLYVD